MKVLQNPQIVRTITLLIAVWLVGIPAQAKYGGGSGTAEDPYQIATAADLILLGRIPEDYHKHFILTADVDLDPNLPGRKVFTRAVIAPKLETRFTGVFDGNGHTISHLTIKGEGFLGLFRQLGSGAEVRDLGVVDVNIIGSGNDVGGLAGDNAGSLIRCHSTGAVSDTNWRVGGLVGTNSGSLTHCYSTGAVSGNTYAGGLVGYNGGTVTHCYSAGVVSSIGAYVGGLVGGGGGSLTYCYSTGAVSGGNPGGGLVGYNRGAVTQCCSSAIVRGNEHVGGLVGSNASQGVAQCFSTGMVSGTKYVGGLVGYNYGTMSNSYSTGPVSGGYYVAGLVGQNNGDVLQCYSTGAVSGTGQYVGGLVGYGGVVTYSFWDVQTSGQTKSAGGTGKTTAQMQMASTFVCWVFEPTVWTIDEGKDYPRLWWENAPGDPITRAHYYGGGTGTQADPYLINTGEQLNTIGLIECDWDKHFKLMADIDLSTFDGKDGSPAFNIIAPDTDTVNSGFQGTAFTGVLDGNGQKISDLTTTGQSYLGLFGQLGTGAEVKNLGVVDVNIIASGDYVGGLVGYNDEGIVTQCYSTGAVTGTGENLGGLVGQNSAVIKNSYSLASAKADNYVGGLVGRSYGRITNCYSTGIVVGNDHFGGLMGYNGGSVTASFWDTQTSGQTSSAGGTRKTTAEMQTGSTFLCWVFEPTVWTIDEGKDYPRLWWENAPGEPITRVYCYGGGSGTQPDPYLIYTAEQLNAIALVPCDLDKHFKLMADIDLSDYSGTGFNTIGSGSTAFAGVFDGNDHAVSNFSYTSNGTYNIGLFGYVSGPNSVIKNVKLTWPNIDAGTGGSVGALVGYLGDGTITNCHIDGGSVSGGWQIGGLVGTSYQGTITDCNSTATVSGNGSVGGLVGWNRGTINYCDSAGHILGNDNVGGLVGRNGSLVCGRNGCNDEPGTIYDSYSTAGVLGTGSNCGGLVGSNDVGEIARCYASGIVLGVSTVGGLAGWNQDEISSCYSTADVAGEKGVGGLVGLNTTISSWWGLVGTITNCYATGLVLGDSNVGGLVGVNEHGAVIASSYGTGAVGGSQMTAGGLVGSADANDVVASFWDTQTSGPTTIAVGTGKTTAEMQTAKTFLDAGWDFVGESQNGTENIWAICEGLDYPKLAWQFVIGDYNGDNQADFMDFCIFGQHWLGTDSSFWCGAGGKDLTSDGFVDFEDLMVLADNWLRGFD